jgi:hypothetical protein
MTAAHLTIKLSATNEAALTITNTQPITVRAFRAAVLRLAATIEERSEYERWLVHVERGEAYGALGRETRTTRIWIECASDDQAELQRAASVLSVVANQEEAR